MGCTEHDTITWQEGDFFFLVFAYNVSNNELKTETINTDEKKLKLTSHNIRVSNKTNKQKRGRELRHIVNLF